MTFEMNSSAKLCSDPSRSRRRICSGDLHSYPRRGRHSISSLCVGTCSYNFWRKELLLDIRVRLSGRLSPWASRRYSGEAKQTASAAVDQARQTAQAAWHEAKSKISDPQPLETYVREKPNPSSLGCAWGGFIMGLLVQCFRYFQSGFSKATPIESPYKRWSSNRIETALKSTDTVH
jgi:hypothetical protein